MVSLSLGSKLEVDPQIIFLAQKNEIKDSFKNKKCTHNFIFETN